MRNLEGEKYTPNTTTIKLRDKKDGWKVVVTDPRKVTKKKLH
jgi:hypothetical protein